MSKCGDGPAFSLDKLCCDWIYNLLLTEVVEASKKYTCTGCVFWDTYMYNTCTVDCTCRTIHTLQHVYTCTLHVYVLLLQCTVHCIQGVGEWPVVLL